MIIVIEKLDVREPDWCYRTLICYALHTIEMNQDTKLSILIKFIGCTSTSGRLPESTAALNAYEFWAPGGEQQGRIFLFDQVCIMHFLIVKVNTDHCQQLPSFNRKYQGGNDCQRLNQVSTKCNDMERFEYNNGALVKIWWQLLVVTEVGDTSRYE